jgi:AcrR family transcriptional regulator
MLRRVGRRRTQNPRGQGDRLRSDLLASTARLLAQNRSPDAVTLRGVAADAGVSPTAVYRHFADRDELLSEAIAWCWDRFDAALEVADTGDPVADFRRQGEAYLRFAREEPGIYRVLFSHLAPAGRPQAGRRVFQKLVDRVAALLGAGGDRRDPHFVAVEVHTWIHGIADLAAFDPTLDEEITARLLDELGPRLGLMAPGGPAPS